MKTNFLRISMITSLCFMSQVLSACSPASSPAGSTPSTTPSSSTQASTTPATNPSATPVSVAPADVLNTCGSYVDRTAADADREIKWDLSVGSEAERCMTVKVGQTVSFRGDFTRHPLKAKGGDSPSLFSQAADLVSNPGLAGEEYTPFEFKSAGTFGYVCGVHPSMTGVIRVIP